MVVLKVKKLNKTLNKNCKQIIPKIIIKISKIINVIHPIMMIMIMMTWIEIKLMQFWKLIYTIFIFISIFL